MLKKYFAYHIAIAKSLVFKNSGKRRSNSNDHGNPEEQKNPSSGPLVVRSHFPSRRAAVRHQ